LGWRNSLPLVEESFQGAPGYKQAATNPDHWEFPAFDAVITQIPPDTQELCRFLHCERQPILCSLPALSRNT
jgi:hypothetical protein